MWMQPVARRQLNGASDLRTGRTGRRWWRGSWASPWAPARTSRGTPPSPPSPTPAGGSPSSQTTSSTASPRTSGRYPHLPNARNKEASSSFLEAQADGDESDGELSVRGGGGLREPRLPRPPPGRLQARGRPQPRRRLPPRGPRGRRRLVPTICSPCSPGSRRFSRKKKIVNLGFSAGKFVEGEPVQSHSMSRFVREALKPSASVSPDVPPTVPQP